MSRTSAAAQLWPAAPTTLPAGCVPADALYRPLTGSLGGRVVGGMGGWVGGMGS